MKSFDSLTCEEVKDLNCGFGRFSMTTVPVNRSPTLTEPERFSTLLCAIKQKRPFLTIILHRQNLNKDLIIDS